MANPLPNSPAWWVDRLSRRLATRQPRYDRLGKYACGDHPLPEGDERARDLFIAFQRKSRTNYTGLVVSSVRERMHVTGFRTGGAATAEVDGEAWRIWQANHLDADSDLVHDAALTYSDAFVMVGPNPADESTPLITPESPMQMIVESDPVNRRVLLAGLKTWVDDAAKVQRAVLYLPNEIHYFQRAARLTSAAGWILVAPDWTTGPTKPTPNPLGEVPIVRFLNRPRLARDDLDRDGLGEFEDAIDIQDRINNGVLDRLVISKLQAYRQRIVKGIQTEDENGNPIDLPFIPGVDMLWAVEDTEVVFDEFQQVDLSPLLKAMEADVKAFVTQTGLPPHYVAGDLVNTSADALAAAEARLVARIRDHMRYFGESWEQVLRLAFKWTNKVLAPDAEVLWADPERKTDAQLADAAVKKGQAGVPWRQRMEDLNYSPQQIDRMEVEKLTESLTLNASAPAIRVTDTVQQQGPAGSPVAPDPAAADGQMPDMMPGSGG